LSVNTGQRADGKGQRADGNGNQAMDTVVRYINGEVEAGCWTLRYVSLVAALISSGMWILASVYLYSASSFD